MIWTQPKTWTNEPLVAADLNTHLRDNLNALKDLPSYSYQSASDYLTSSQGPVFVDSVNMNKTIPLYSTSNMLVGFNGTVSNTGTSLIYFRLLHNGVIIQQSMVRNAEHGDFQNVTMEVLLENVPAGTQTFAVQWWVQNYAGVLYGGKNQFYVQGV